jgi:hypothetical protein
MTKEKLEQATLLAQKIDDMARIEGYIKDFKIGQIIMYSMNTNISGSSIDNSSVHGKFIIENMLDAGAYAAMTMRVAAENDLEKL